MLIYYCEFTHHTIVGSINEQKIIALAKGKPVRSCDIADFRGRLISRDWFGEYPVAVANADTPNFDIGRYGSPRAVAQL